MRAVAFSTGVLVAGPQALEVEHADTTEAADFDRSGRADHTVHGRGHERQFEAERVELPGDVDILGVARASARHDRDVVEPVCLPAGFPEADLDLCHVRTPWSIWGNNQLRPQVRAAAATAAAPSP
jgi:hypothetical protein